MCDKEEYDFYGKKECGCTEKVVLATLVVIFAFVVGILLESAIGLVALLGAPIVTVIAIALGVLMLIKLIIYALCCKKKCC